MTPVDIVTQLRIGDTVVLKKQKDDQPDIAETFVCTMKKPLNEHVCLLGYKVELASDDLKTVFTGTILVREGQCIYKSRYHGDYLVVSHKSGYKGPSLLGRSLQEHQSHP